MSSTGISIAISDSLREHMSTIFERRFSAIWTERPVLSSEDKMIDIYQKGQSRVNLRLCLSLLQPNTVQLTSPPHVQYRYIRPPPGQMS